jgi:hypothetical protein
MSYFESRVPTAFEIQDSDRFPQVVLTGESPVWEPYDPDLMKVEEELRHALGLVDFNSSLAGRRISTCRTSPLLTLTHTFDCKFLAFVHHRECFETTSIRRKGTISAEDLAKRWRIGLNQARHTIEKTTQLAIRDFSNTLGERRIRPSNRQLKYRRFDAICYTDTLFGPCNSLTNQFTCAQVHVTEFDWTIVFPMKLKDKAVHTLEVLHRTFGVFHTMIRDGTKELVGDAFVRRAQQAGSIVRPIEAYTPNHNRAESAIRELKRMYRRMMLATNTPQVLWDHAIEYVAMIRSHTALDLFSLSGETPTTKLTGDTADISHLCQFGWFDPVWFIDPKEPLMKKVIGRYLGPSTTVGDAMCSKVLHRTTNVRVRSSVFPLSVTELDDPTIKTLISDFDSALADKLKARIAGISIPDDEVDDDDPFVPYEADNVEPFEMPEADTVSEEAYGKYISACLMIPDASGIRRKATVKKRVRDDDGNYVGRANNNPVLDTALFEIEFEDGQVGTYAAN